MHGGADVVFSPDVGPPVVGDAGQEAGDVNTYNDFPGAGWVGDRVVLEWWQTAIYRSMVNGTVIQIEVWMDENSSTSMILLGT